MRQAVKNYDDVGSDHTPSLYRHSIDLQTAKVAYVRRNCERVWTITYEPHRSVSFRVISYSTYHLRNTKVTFDYSIIPQPNNIG